MTKEKEVEVEKEERRNREAQSKRNRESIYKRDTFKSRVYCRTRCLDKCYPALSLGCSEAPVEKHQN